MNSRLRAWTKRIAIDAAIICVGLYAIGCTYGMFRINSIMFHPPPPGYSWETPDIVNIGDDASPVSALWLPCAGTNKVFLFSYGNGEDIGGLMRVFKGFPSAKLSVLCYDYPGYGLSTGKPTEQGAYAAAEAAYRFLTARCGIAPPDIIVLGRSLGSGPACYLAEKFPVGGLVVLSGFTSAPRVVTRVRILPFDPFPNLRRIGNISCPKLFIHGTDDDTIPLSHGKALFAAAQEPKAHLWVDGAGHDDLIWFWGEAKFLEVLHAFANEKQEESR